MSRERGVDDEDRKERRRGRRRRKLRRRKGRRRKRGGVGHRNTIRGKVTSTQAAAHGCVD